jgi:probable F420-dependent oxidoreductase
MRIVRDFRFGVNIWQFATREELVAMVRYAEAYGFDIAMTADHLGHDERAPFPTLVAMAGATERMRLGTFVLNVGFWQPHLLAREVATTDLLTGGRLELGLGTGYIKAESDAAGIPWQPFLERVKRIEDTVVELDRLFADVEGGYGPAQRPRPPLLIAGNSEPMLRLAAERADIVGLTGGATVPGRPGAIRELTPAEFDRRIAFFRECAGDRLADIEVNLLIQWVAVTDDRRAAAEEVGRVFEIDGPPEYVLDIPTLLIGSEEQIVEQLHERRERYGISYFTVLQRSLDAFGPIIARARA